MSRGYKIGKEKKVTLNWKNKDCLVINKEDNCCDNTTVKKRKVYYSIVCDRYKINEMLEPKPFINIKRIDKSGEHPFIKFNRDPVVNKKRCLPYDTITDNLIIKGDSVIVLYSLLEEFKGKVKVIYIDPPYNTRNSTLGYNDTFDHWEWLTFMRNRLEVAKELLKEDGVIFVQIDNSRSLFGESPEIGYLMVLMDEIFGRHNYVTMFIWKKKNYPGNTEKLIGTITESILMYAKDITKLSVNLNKFTRKYKYHDKKGKYNLEYPVKTNEGIYKRKTMNYPVKDPSCGKIYYPPDGKRWTVSKKTMDRLIQEGKIVFLNDKLYIKKYQNDYIHGNSKLFTNLLDRHGSTKVAKNELKKLGFNREFFNSPKPEVLLKTLLDMVIKNDKDIVLDFFLGSGTTTAVAHKIGLQYIGIEQKDSIVNFAVEMMKKVISGEQYGISKKVNWRGGGDFVYMEIDDKK